MRPTFKNEFESCYLRHRYISRAKRVPTKESMEPFYGIVDKLSKNTYYMYKHLFVSVGMELDDINSIGKVQLASFLGLFSLECDSEKMSNFKKARTSIHGKCTKDDILDKNKADLTCFLKQRMEDLVRVCRQKVKNVTGTVLEEYVVYTGKKTPPKNLDIVSVNPQAYGFKKIDYSAFRVVKKAFKLKDGEPVSFVNDTWYICIPNKKNLLTMEDFACQNIDPYDNLHNMNPEDFFNKRSTEKFMEKKTFEFAAMTDSQKKTVITDFLEKKKSDKGFSEEIVIAKKLLEKLNGSTNV